MFKRDISAQTVLQSLPKSRDRGIDVRSLTEALKLNASQEPQARALLDQFVRAGVAGSKGGRYWRKHAAGTLIGTLRGTRSGHAFVVPHDPLERDRGDLHVGSREMGEALHGDTVIAQVTRASERGREGRVQLVLHRANQTVVGSFIKLKTGGLVAPIDERFLHEISITDSDSLSARNDDFVNVEITRPPIAGRPPRGRVIEVIGPPDLPGIDLEIIIRKHRLPNIFPEAALEEAENASTTAIDIAGRDDLRELLTITIDGETARDFDDAVSLERRPNGRLILGVHIADVSHYVREGSALDEEAFRRGTSVYFPERAIPMLPEQLSNDICSLKPRVDRLTMSALIELNVNGRVVNYRLAPSVIHSRHRMTYSAVNEIINNPGGDTARQYSDVRDTLLAMHELTGVLIKRREERGAIDFDLPEAELLFNDEGQIGGIVRSERNIAHRLIEEFMLLANETVASHLEALRVPVLYRIHEQPNPDKVEEFAEIAESFGHKFSLHGPIPQRGFQRLATEIRDKPEERMLSFLMLRSMQRARYSPHNEGHFGLAMKTYTHFTSPIRRYPDLIVHRVLREAIEIGRGEMNVNLGAKHALKRISTNVLDEERETELRAALEAIGDRSSERERAADDAERELMDWRKADFMAERVGDEFDGVITSVKDYGLYIELDEFFVEGLVHVSTLADDHYEFDQRKHKLVGRRGRREYRLGDRVRVTVDRVDRARHLIDFSVV